MDCIICHKNIPEHDHYFKLTGIPFRVPEYVLTVCEDCAAVTTITDLYMNNLIEMTNSEDAAIESTAVISDPIDAVYEELNPDQVENSFPLPDPIFTNTAE